MLKAKSRALIALVLALALVAAACGSDDEDSGGDGGDSTTTVAADDGGDDTGDEAADEAADDEMTDDEAADDEAADDEMTDEATDDGGGDGGAVTVSVDDCDSDTVTEPVTDEVRLASSIPQTGGPAVLFAPFGDGLQAYVDFYNETNGGIGGEIPISLDLKDDQYVDTETAGNITEQLDTVDPHAFVGIIGTPNNLAVREELNAVCTPQLYNATGAPEWGDLDNFPWTIGGLVPYPVESRAFVDFAASELPEGGRAGLFYVNNDFGASYVEPFTEAAEAAGFEVVAEETIAAEDSGAPSSQLTNLVEADVDIILAVPLGAQCIAFMNELANAKAQNADFDPIVYQTATCASTVFFGAAGENATGVYTSSNLKDVANPDIVASDEAVSTFIDNLAAANPDADPTGIAPAGWTIMETAIAAIEQAYATGELTRQTIMEAVRNLDFQPSLLRDGLTYLTGPGDGYVAEGTQIVQWNGTGFDEIGEVLDFEGTTVYEG